MTTLSDIKALCTRFMEILIDGSMADFAVIVHPEAVDWEAKEAPPAGRGQGPVAFYAIALWLRKSFSDLHWDVQHAIAEGDLVALRCTMSGLHSGTFCNYGEDGRVSAAFPATGKRFATVQTHWFRIAEGKVVEHWANRDDLGTAMQLGWLSSPLYLLRTVLARIRARRGEISAA